MQTAQVQELQELRIEDGPLGRRLKHPVTVSIPAVLTKDEKDIVRFVVDSLSSLMPRLVPFTLNHQSTMNLARYFRRYRSSSPRTLVSYMHSLHRFANYAELSPDRLIEEVVKPDGTMDPQGLAAASRRLEEYLGGLQADGLSPGTIINYAKAVKTFYRINKVRLDLPYTVRNRRVCRDRAPTPEEIQKLMDVADLREKVVVAILTLSGVREGTLARLQYRHVRQDLEKNVLPVHVHVEADITKGKYHDFDTFLGQEATDCLRLSLEARRRGTQKIPPETINDKSPLIRDERSRAPRHITPAQIGRIIRSLYSRIGLQGEKRGRRYTVRAHSLRKYFKTQLMALGTQADYVEYMMGHTVSAYHDIEMKGIDFLRGIYQASGLSIKPKTKFSRIDTLKEIVRAWGLNPEEILTREALTMPHQTPYTQDSQVETLSRELKELTREIILENQSTERYKFTPGRPQQR